MGKSNIKKDPVRLRKRKLATGLQSLYLDIYVDGKRSYEYLRLYLVEEKTRQDKEHNRDTMALAEAVKAERLLEVINGKFGFGVKKNILFKDFYMSICEGERQGMALSTYHSWKCAWRQIVMYDRRSDVIHIADITTDWVNGFVDFLMYDTATYKSIDTVRGRPLKRNSKVIYLNRLKTCLKRAYKEGYIIHDVTLGMNQIQPEETSRQYLTIEELKKLSATPCRFPVLRRAFLFSCLTGLRRSDVLALQWSNIFKNDKYTRIIFTQVKTKKQEYLDINEEAADLLGEQGEPEGHPFYDLGAPNETNHRLREWCLMAGINKHLTFHSGRHTFATMLLTLGTDLYTVSKLLGHRNIKTTQVYAKIVDQKKQEAINNIPNILK